MSLAKALCSRAPLHLLLLLFVAFSISLTAQESEKEKEREKEKAGKKGTGVELVKAKGSLRCEKPEKDYSIDVPDRAGHSLVITHRKCTWTEPMEILGTKTRNGEWDEFSERMEGSLHPHTYEVDTMEDGEKITFQTMGHIESDKNPTTTKGRFSYTRGTGKFKGIKGGGTYEGSIDADGVMTLELEGEYEPSAFEAAGKKK
ncbi:MAG TPA: hypothetical protein VMI10_21135 [Terriglobales bacterium]|nr:hypothetical protein [Terriglobales bacterium]